jgi:hypothetical protein
MLNQDGKFPKNKGGSCKLLENVPKTHSRTPEDGKSLKNRGSPFKILEMHQNHLFFGTSENSVWTFGKEGRMGGLGAVGVVVIDLLPSFPDILLRSVHSQTRN